MVDPKLLCRQHLLGEHVETHMFVGTLNKGISVEGYLSRGLLEIHHLRDRHDELVAEMLRRGYEHHSELPAFAVVEAGHIDVEANLEELASRCPDCAVLMGSSMDPRVELTMDTWKGRRYLALLHQRRVERSNEGYIWDGKQYRKSTAENGGIAA
jgi:Pyrimidine dimer DNA glycosylase